MWPRGREGEEGERNPRDPIVRWRGLIAKRRKEGRVAARGRVVGGKEPGQELGFWRLGGLWAGWATLSRLKFIFLLQINLEI